MAIQKYDSSSASVKKISFLLFRDRINFSWLLMNHSEKEGEQGENEKHKTVSYYPLFLSGNFISLLTPEGYKDTSI